MARARILIIDDEKNILSSLGRALELEGYSTLTSASGHDGLTTLEQQGADLVLLDVRLPDIDGLSVLQTLTKSHPGLPVIMMSGHGTIETAVKAVHLGARDFIEKPLATEKVLLTIDNVLRLDSLERENVELRREAERRYEIVGHSPVMRELLERIEVTAPSSGRVLITGEHGTGKELVARALHRLSRRSSGPFVKLNCAAIPTELIESELFGHEKGSFTGAIRNRKGKFEQANGGTLFLDEIGDMKLEMQAKLLRVLQESEFERVGSSDTIHVDVRVIAASNKDLPAEIEAGRFRADLYYRLNVVPFELPPLRQRREDIRVLVEHFVSLLCDENAIRPRSFAPEALALLEAHAWPGNVRELKNVVERLLILAPGPEIGADDVRAVLRIESAGAQALVSAEPQSLKDAMAAAEHAVLLDALRRNGWHIANTARALGLERSHLYKKMRSHDIKREQDGPGED